MIRHLGIKFTPTIKFILEKIECSVPHQGNPYFGDSGLAFGSATTFPGYISMYTAVHLEASLR